MIGIVDLVRRCEEQYASHLGWFTVLGGRVRSEPDPRRQRLYATAAHRHAWHAQLWAQRRPAIPHDATHELPPPATVELGTDPAAAYRSHLVEQRASLAQLREQIDAELDPATHRVIALVDADLAELLDQLA